MPDKIDNSHNLKRGAPRGNQNARKHGFYSLVLDADEQSDFEQAVEVFGIDEEIALLRTKIKSVLRHDPENIDLLMKAITTLSGLLKTRYNIGKEDKTGLREAIGNVLKDVALPLGIGIGSLFDK
ncbi:MAG: hypothetical protein PHE15_06690 [Dehalococcoidales bacterium]|nr:hypothetical protein [Dehalococcoidales bacterium]